MRLEVAAPSLGVALALFLVASGMLLIGHTHTGRARTLLLLRMGLRNMFRRPSQSSGLLVGFSRHQLSWITNWIWAGRELSHLCRCVPAKQELIGHVDASVSGTFQSVSRIYSSLASLRRLPHVGAAAALFIAAIDLTISSRRSGLAVHRIDVYAIPKNFRDGIWVTSNRDRQARLYQKLGPGQAALSRSRAHCLKRPGAEA